MEKRKLSELTPYERNPRNNKDAVDRVLESLNRHGQVKPIVVSAKGKPFEQEIIVAGHTTMQALKRFGAKEAFVVVKEFADEAQFVDYNIRDNKSGEFAQWDDQELANLSAEFEIDLDEMGFEDFDIEEESEGNTDEDAVPEVPEEPTAKLGQMWKLGSHRLMCGDSTDREQVERLMDGEKADLMLTDPPYGINIANNPVRQKHEKKEGDLKPISRAALDMFFLYCEKSIIWGGNYFELDPQQCFYVWDKKQPENFSLAMCEMAWTNIGGPAKIYRQSVTSYKKEHPTQKPVELLEWCLSKQDGDVFDPFGGSGSTLIACEKTKRKCRMMELDPKYIDVIIKRWEDFTGKKAELIES